MGLTRLSNFKLVAVVSEVDEVFCVVSREEARGFARLHILTPETGTSISTNISKLIRTTAMLLLSIPPEQ